MNKSAHKITLNASFNAFYLMGGSSITNVLYVNKLSSACQGIKNKSSPNGSQKLEFFSKRPTSKKVKGLQEIYLAVW